MVMYGLPEVVRPTTSRRANRGGLRKVAGSRAIVQRRDGEVRSYCADVRNSLVHETRQELTLFRRANILQLFGIGLIVDGWNRLLSQLEGEFLETVLGWAAS